MVAAGTTGAVDELGVLVAKAVNGTEFPLAVNKAPCPKGLAA